MSDALFRGAFSQPLVARQFLSAWLPEGFLNIIDWSTLELQKIAGINEALTERREDVVYRVQAKNADQPMHFYLLTEHQAKSQPMMAWRVMEYEMLIWQQDLRARRAGPSTNDPADARLPMVVPIVLHPGPGKWGPVMCLRDLIAVPDGLESWAAKFVPDAGFLLVDLADVEWQRLAGGHAARAVLAAIQQERRGALGFEQVRRIVAEFFADEDSDCDRASAVQAVAGIAGMLWTFLLGASELRGEQIRSIVDETVPPPQKEDFMSTAEILREEGRQEGQVLALREAVADLLQERFTRVPEGLLEALKSTEDPARLRGLLRSAYSCADLEAFSSGL